MIAMEFVLWHVRHGDFVLTGWGYLIIAVLFAILSSRGNS